MVFSIRTLIIVVTIAAIWLAALVAGSPLFLAVVSHLSLLFIMLTLGLAIVGNPAKRPFWAGFFLVAISNVALSSLPLGNIGRPIHQVETGLADVIQGDLSARPNAQQYMEVVIDGVLRHVSVASIPYEEERQNLRGAFVAMFSMALGCVGGILCQWFTRGRNDTNSTNG